MMIGPEEDFDNQYITTRTHTVEQIEAIYREVYFAGLPTTKPFPQQYLQNMFEQFGKITNFTYLCEIGAGSVTFEHGCEGEAFYHVFNFARMPNGVRLYLEFAQFLPEVNVMLTKKELSAQTSRQLIRTLPRVRNFCYETGNIEGGKYIKVFSEKYYKGKIHDRSSTLHALIQRQNNNADDEEFTSEHIHFLNFIRYRKYGLEGKKALVASENMYKRCHGRLERALELIRYNTVDALIDVVHEDELVPLN
eukprot:PhM_4_TR10038/c0_g1_i1/m.38742